MHLHVGFMFGVVVFLYWLIFNGLMKITALNFKGHPLSDAILEVY